MDGRKMKNDAKILPLRCKNCGAELPVMGQYVTFQCPSCRRHWLLGEDGLQPLEISRAAAPGDYAHRHNLPEDASVEGAIYIPFWIIPVDTRPFVEGIRRLMDEIAKSTEELIKRSADVKRDEKEDLFSINFDYRRREERVFSTSTILADSAAESDLPQTSEVNFLLKKFSDTTRLNIFVPAFLSVNPYAYIKVGRLMTVHQPEFRLVHSNDSMSPILCALTKSVAMDLTDFIFIATLPERIQRAGKLVEAIHLETSGEAVLIEFPFTLEGHYLTSLHGGFSVSRKLVSLDWQRETV